MTALRFGTWRAYLKRLAHKLSRPPGEQIPCDRCGKHHAWNRTFGHTFDVGHVNICMRCCGTIHEAMRTIHKDRIPDDINAAYLELFACDHAAAEWALGSLSVPTRITGEAA